MSNPKPAWPAHCDDGAWYCDAHGTYGCERCGSETPPTARELLEHLRAGHHPQGQVGAVAYGLAARVEAVLALAEKRHAHEAYDACLAEVRRILNGESK